MRESRQSKTAPPDSPPVIADPLPLRQTRGVTGRAIALGALLTPLNCFWVLRMEEVMYGPYPSLLSLFANVVFVLLLLVALNALVRRVSPRLAFSQGELLTTYTMLAIATGMAGQSGLNIVCGMIAHTAWFSTPSNGWDKFLGAFPDWLIIKDRNIVRGHFLGNSTFYRWDVLHAWMTPILAWTLLWMLLLWTAYCINVLIRRQWADRERLTFPIIWLPMEMTEGGTGHAFFTNKLMWSGFAIAAGLNLWNGTAFLFPSLPSLPIGIIDLKPLFTAKPWNAIDWTPSTLYPLAIGLGYLLPLDLLFSCWFFFLFWKGQLIVSNAMAWDTVHDFPFIHEQGFGSVIGLFIYYLWSGRKTYAAIWRRAFDRHPAPLPPPPPKNRGRETMANAGAFGSPLPSLGEGSGVRATPPPYEGGGRGEVSGGEGVPEEGLSERTALLGVGVGFLGLVAFCMAAKVAWWVAVVFFSFYVAMLVVVTRIRAELGSPVHDFTFMGPDSMLIRGVGTASLSQTDLAFLSLSYPLIYSRSNDTMPIALESQQMARLRNLDARRMFAVILFATLFGTLSTFWAYEHQAYTLGTAAKFNAGTHFAQEGYERMQNWVGGTQDWRPNSMALSAFGVGFGMTLGLLWLRLRYFGFPLHPIGYAVASAWAINIVWLPLFIAWVFKGLAMRYGGLRVYRQFLPFFLGLVLGDCVIGCGWGLLSLLLNMRTYNFFGA